MTQIRSLTQPTRRAGELGVHSLGGFNLIVPDMKLAETFYTEFGLNLQHNNKQVDVFTFGNETKWGTLSEGKNKQLSHLSFAIFEDDFKRFDEHLQNLHIKRLTPPQGFDQGGIWFHNTDGLLIELRVAAKSSPNEKSAFNMPVAKGGEQGSIANRAAPRIHPKRLAHILIFTADVMASIKFYSQVLGLRLSDHSGDGIAFMHGVHGSDHHLIALAKAENAGLHHVSWDVGSINEIGLGAMRMADKGFSQGWGLGRHVLGSNYFHYIRDPWGSYSEYSADIDYIPVNCDWQAQDHPPEDSFYIWGPKPPEDFAHNYEQRP